MKKNLYTLFSGYWDSVKLLPVGCYSFNKICAVLSSGCVMWCPCRNLFDPVLLCPLTQERFFVGDRDYWKKTSNALEGNHCLRLLHIHCSGPFSLLHTFILPHQLSKIIESVCRKEKLTELIIDTDRIHLRGTIP